MFNDNYSRRNKGKKPVVAICYDFDKTLTPNEMQAQGYIQSLGYKVSEFWNKSNGMAEDNDMDENLAYMYMMVKESIDHHKLDRKTLEEYGSEVNLFPGVEDWFKRIREYGAERGVIVEHYIISSGIKEMIEGTDIAKKGEFEKIYASSFYYNEEGVAEWPAQVVNYTNKTQFLFRIQKGTLDINDPGINDFFPPDEIRVPFRNIVYIGDSDTDIPCMKLVNTYGGYSIGVFDPKHKHSKDKVYKMIKDKRIKYFAPADYREDGKLDLIIKNIIERTVFNEKLESTYYTCIREAYEDEKKSPRD
ncbi:MAG: haloacid dehalogenase-like hydrolase [Peptoniphilus harei]|uniref:haloacid dehalogenase-like hydrolase n=1 Tax=Peptoniphilus harei TaxID=54005 RepID=UPI0028FEBC6E|nr:haloacid dehalogenase-like hydrolase [Peptoniphilus harei]MDU3086361.1 haloacid dehalogenase-like hydrolase [Peptoniphilus harei]